jgi:hypothetical protein
VIVGSSASALIGLQFVVITLIADMPIEDGMLEASGAYATPSRTGSDSVLAETAVKVGGGTDVEMTRGFALEDVEESQRMEVVGPYGFEP